MINRLSRRDCMKVARHEMPGSVAPRSPSRRVRRDGLARASYRLGRWTPPGATDHTVPYGTDHVCHVSRHFMPGYLHVVPSGHADGRTIGQIAVTPTLQHSNTPGLQHSRTPTLQHSNTPTLQHSNTPTLQHSARQDSSTRTSTSTSTKEPVRLTEPQNHALDSC